MPCGTEVGSEWPLEARAGAWAAGETDPSEAGEWGTGASQSLEEPRAPVPAPRGRPPQCPSAAAQLRGDTH